MRFIAGDDTEQTLRRALTHEFFRAEDAFNDFVDPRNMAVAADLDRRIAYKAYNSYARFIHHLYEFYIGCFKWSRLNTAKINYDQAEQLILMEVSKLLALKRERIRSGRAPIWENSLRSYPTDIPPNFAADFRTARNIASAHVDARRATFNMTMFFQTYHMFMLMLYEEAHWLWSKELMAFPDLGEVTSFSLAVRSLSPVHATSLGTPGMVAEHFEQD